MKRQRIIALCGVLAGLVTSNFLTGCASTHGGVTARTKNVDWLFVQNSSGLSTGKNRIVLKNVNPQTICFSDRPDRVAGHMTTAAFVPMWSQGSDSFLKNPPNATLSVLRDGKVESAVVTLRNPKLKGGDLSYDVTVLEGALPKRSGAASLFIDVIAMPCTPYSYAGAARRAAYGYHPYATPVYAPTVVHYGAYAATGASAARPCPRAYIELQWNSTTGCRRSLGRNELRITRLDSASRHLTSGNSMAAARAAPSGLNIIVA